MNKRLVIYFVLIVCVMVFGYHGINAFLEWHERWVGENKWEDIRDVFVGDLQSPIIVEDIEDNDTSVLGTLDVFDGDVQRVESVQVTPYEVPNLNIDFVSLRSEQNDDIYAWIYIPDTKINYAVLQHPTEENYYLDHNIDDSKGYPGCIYSQSLNSKDFSDRNTVLYGHNMKNGSMFAGLHLYSDYEYMSQHPYVFVYTEDYTLVYKVFAAQRSDDRHQLKEYNLGTTSGWLDYISNLTLNSNKNYVYDKTTAIGSTSRILTMSTCIGNDEYRWLVHGILINVIIKEG